jgi:Skp family chaperone for outer membrane proteins
LEECGPCPVFAGYTLAFVLQLRKKHEKTSGKSTEKLQEKHGKLQEKARKFSGKSTKFFRESTENFRKKHGKLQEKHGNFRENTETSGKSTEKLQEKARKNLRQYHYLYFKKY